MRILRGLTKSTEHPIRAPYHSEPYSSHPQRRTKEGLVAGCAGFFGAEYMAGGGTGFYDMGHGQHVCYAKRTRILCADSIHKG